MKNYANGPEIPLGFGIALAQNLPALNYFAGLSRGEQQAILARIHTIGSKEEMRAFVQSLVP